MMKSSPNAAKAEYDLQFLGAMSAHHQSAMDMAKLVDQRAAHEELKKMIEDQQKAIQQLQDWKKQWYAGKGDAVNTQMPGMKESMRDMPMMDKLAASMGKQFASKGHELRRLREKRHEAGAIGRQ
jgi:uncharacterized protein (DUF305 family)